MGTTETLISSAVDRSNLEKKKYRSNEVDLESSINLNVAVHVGISRIFVKRTLYYCNWSFMRVSHFIDCLHVPCDISEDRGHLQTILQRRDTKALRLKNTLFVRVSHVTMIATTEQCCTLVKHAPL